MVIMSWRSTLLVLAAVTGARAFLAPPPTMRMAPMMHAQEPTTSSEKEGRRSAIAKTLLLPLAPWLAQTLPAQADSESIPVSKDRMGGLLEPFSDVTKGWRIMKPYGWNQFDGIPGAYEMKWADIVAANKQQIVVTTSPVKSTTTSIDALGDVADVGDKLASSRDSKLVSARAVDKDGVLFYMFEFKNDQISQKYQLCVNKGRLWSVDASAPTQRWDKVEKLFDNALLSFMPKL